MTMSTIIDPSKELAGHSWRMLIHTLHHRNKARRAKACNRKPQLLKTIERNIARGKRTRAIVMQALAELGEANSNQLRDKTGLSRVSINRVMRESLAIGKVEIMRTAKGMRIFSLAKENHAI